MRTGRQPQDDNRCGHYPVCYLIGMQTGCIADECKEVCEYDTRATHTSPPAPATDGWLKFLAAIEQLKCHKCSDDISERCNHKMYCVRAHEIVAEHDAQVAKAAREQFIKHQRKIEDKIVHHSMGLSDEQFRRIDTIFSESVKSLRAQKQGGVSE